MLLRRADAQRGILLVCRELSRRAAWPRPELGDDDMQAMLVWPTWAVLIERTGLSRSTVAAHLSWLRRVGLLGLVAGGTTPDLSPAILADGYEGNAAAVYVLCAPARLRLVAVSHPDDVGAEHVHDGRDLPTDPVTGAPREDVVVDLATGEVITPDPLPHQPPASGTASTADRAVPSACREDVRWPRPLQPVDTSRTPTPPRRGEVIPPYARESATQSGAGLRPASKSPLPAGRETRQNAPDLPAGALTTKPAGTKTGRMIAAQALQGALPVLWRISTAHVAHLTRELWLAGWTPAEVVTAIGHRPDGAPWRHEHDVRHVPGWLRHRLAVCRHDPVDPTSPVRRPPSETAAVRAAAEARARAERRTTDAATRGAATPAVQVTGWAEARAQLAARAAARRAADRARYASPDPT